MRLSELAEKLSCRLEGDGSIEITGAASLEDAERDDVSFLANLKYTNKAKITTAGAIIVDEDFEFTTTPLLRTTEPYLTFAKAIELFHPAEMPAPGIHSTAAISSTAKLGSDVHIGAFSFIDDGVILGDRVCIEANCNVMKNAVIGDRTIIHAGAVIRQEVRIGSRCVIQSNSVIGSDGFGYARKSDGSWYPIRQTGTVILEDEVEVGAGTTIDRASVGETRICRGSKIDNLVQIGHGCTVGESSLICGQVGLAGSTKVGNFVILAGQVGASGHLTIGDRAVVTAQSGISNSVDPDAVVSGSPAFDNKIWLRSTAHFARLPEMVIKLRTLESRLAFLETALKKLHEQ